MTIFDINNPCETYISPKKRKFRTISIERIPNTEKYHQRAYKSLWRVLIKYLDSGLLLWLYFDYSDKLTETREFNPNHE